MRAVLIAAILALQGCAFSQLREDLSEYYADPEGLAGRVIAEGAAQVRPLEELGGNHGRMGLWLPISFVKERRARIYLLEPYDPARVPVLFVHGAGGSPQDWRYFIEHLDRSKYQPWVYYYPTGMPMELSATWLKNSVAELHARHGFRQLVVTGHSMGGLVARRFIALNAQGGRPAHETFLVTLATPWGGVPFARLGLTLGVYAIPSWRDLVPDSVFLRRVQADALPAVPHHVFYGYLQDGGTTDSDGVISVASQLEPRIEASAAATHGFRTDHSNILESPAVFTRYAAVLASFE